MLWRVSWAQISCVCIYLLFILVNVCVCCSVFTDNFTLVKTHWMVQDTLWQCKLHMILWSVLVLDRSSANGRKSLWNLPKKASRYSLSVYLVSFLSVCMPACVLSVFVCRSLHLEACVFNVCLCICVSLSLSVQVCVLMSVSLCACTYVGDRRSSQLLYIQIPQEQAGLWPRWRPVHQDCTGITTKLQQSLVECRLSARSLVAAVRQLP